MKYDLNLNQTAETFIGSQEANPGAFQDSINCDYDVDGNDDQFAGIINDPPFPPELEPHPFAYLAPWELATFNTALAIAAMGHPVYPARIGPDGNKLSHKSAKYSDGRRWGATTDHHQIHHDWSDWPGAMLGIVTGSVASGGGGLVVIDIDTKEGHGVDGLKNFEDFLKMHGKSLKDLPRSVEALTPTGGYHFYCRLPENLGAVKFIRHLAPGVDVQADKQTIIAPPSYRRDKDAHYRWMTSPIDHPIEEIPDWLLRLLINSKATQKADFDAGAEPFESNTGYQPVVRSGDAETVFKQILSNLYLAKEGERNDTLNYSAYMLGGLVAAGRLDECQVVESLTNAALEIGLGLDETNRTLESGLTAGKLEPIYQSVAGATSSVRFIDLSHDTLAREIENYGFRENALYSPKRNRWFFWDDTRWRPDDDGRHMTLFRDYMAIRADELISAAILEGRNLKQAAAKALEGWAKAEARRLKDRPTITAVESLARSNEGRTVDLERLDKDIFLLGTPDGTVDLKTGFLRPAKREELITKQTACGPAEEGDLPVLWLKFLYRIFDGDQEVIDFMQRLAGYALSGSTKEHKMFFFYGRGRNGKSVFHKVLNRIWVDYSCDAPAELFMKSNFAPHPTGLAGLHGARLVIGSEIPRNSEWNQAEIKKLTGGDRVSARFMRGDFFTYDPQLTLIIAGNDKPTLAGVDPAMRARMVLIPFTVQIPKEEQNHNLEEELFAERREILRWAIEGAVKQSEMGLNIPEKILGASKEYLDDEDILQNFLNEEMVAGNKLRAKVSDVYDRFRGWCSEQGLPVLKRKAFLSEMANRGWAQSRQSAGNFFMGIGLN